jgi:hypothetical protein
MGKRASDEDRQRAQALYAIGRTYREIASELGFTAQAVCNWARAGNWQKGILPDKLVGPDTPQVYESANATPEEVSANTDKLQEANRRRWVDRKAEMADDFADKIQLLMARAFSPCVLKEQKLVGQGGGSQQVTLVETNLELPPPSDQVKLITGVAILVDKASLLVGDATSRVETASLTPAQSSDRLEHIASEFNKRLAAKQAEEAKRAAEGQTG